MAARTQADEAILAAALAPVAYALSNDRFDEYRDKPAVHEKRPITPEIPSGQVLVHDLDISLHFGPGPGPRRSAAPERACDPKIR